MFEVGEFVTFLDEDKLIRVIAEVTGNDLESLVTSQYIRCTRNLAGLTFKVLKIQDSGLCSLEGDNDNLYFYKQDNIRWVFYPQFFTMFNVEENLDISPLFG